MRILRILTGVLLSAAVAVGVTATPAAAHVALVKSSPEDGAEVETTPEAAELTFSEVLDAPSTKVAVTNAAGDTVEQAKPRIADKTITQPLKLPKAGKYTVSYRIVSEDGHPVEDSISFSVASVPEADKSAQSSAAPDKSEAAKKDSAGSGDSGIGWGPVAAVAGGLAVIVVVALLLVRRRSRDS